MLRLEDKVAVVTGGSRGIGAAIARVLAEAGAHVVLNYRSNEDAAERTRAEIAADGHACETLRFDVSIAEQAEAAIAGVFERLSRIDILVNNAGIVRDDLLSRTTESQIQETFGTNVAGAIHCSRAAIRPMIRARGGRIVHLSSVSAELGNAGQSVYSASKAALIGLTKSLAREYAPRGITVNCVAPGFIETEMTARLDEGTRRWILENTPLGRMGTPEDVAHAVLYLCSEEASFVTGQVLRVNGGIYG